MITAEQAKELLAAATPGPWKRYGMAGVSAPDWEIVYEGPVECAECDWRIALTGCVTNDDALLVAAAPDLAQTVIVLAAENAALREQIQRATGFAQQRALTAPRAERERQWLDLIVLLEPKPGGSS